MDGEERGMNRCERCGGAIDINNFLDQFTAMHPDGPDPDRYEVIWLMEIQADQVPIGVEGEANGT